MSDEYLDAWAARWRWAFEAGWAAQRAGQPRDCDLTDGEFLTLSNDILPMARGAWEAGWEWRIGPHDSRTSYVRSDHPTVARDWCQGCGHEAIGMKAYTQPDTA